MMNPERQIILSPFADDKTEAHSNQLLRDTADGRTGLSLCWPDITPYCCPSIEGAICPPSLFPSHLLPLFLLWSEFTTELFHIY